MTEKNLRPGRSGAGGRATGAAPGVLSALFFLLPGCVQPLPEVLPGTSHASALPPLAADRAEPRLALAEHLLESYFASDIAARPTVCMGASDGRSEEALPPAQETALIARFDRLAPFSRCTWRQGAWRDSESGQPALVFAIHSFTCADQSRCSGWAGYTAGAVASPASLYRMDWQSGRWTFTRDRRLIAQ